MVSSFVGFWALVRAFASDNGRDASNAVLLVAVVIVVLALIALWVPRARAAALGGAGGLLAAVATVLVLAVGFGSL